MNPIAKLRTATRLWRRRYGAIRGTWLWMQFLKEKLHNKGDTFTVSIPGTKGPIYLRAYTSDVQVCSQIFAQAELDVPELPENAVYIVDGGANIGLSSIFFAIRYPDAAIDAVEVAKDNLEILTRNSAAYPNINVVPKGLWSSDGYLAIANPEDEPYAYRVEESSADNPDAFPSTSISSLLTARHMDHIDILKIDIEGSEKELFSHGTEWSDNVRCLMIELHDHFKPGCKTAVETALSKRQMKHLQKGEYHIYLT